MQRYEQLSLKARGYDINTPPVILCEVCNINKAIDGDHIRGRKGNLLNDWRYIILVCRKCHTNKGSYKMKCDRSNIVRNIICSKLDDEKIRQDTFLLWDDPSKLPGIMTAIKIEIKTFGGSVLFSYEKEDNTIIKTLQEAVKLKKDLREANLREANLIRADLREADLTGADLTGADLTGAYLRGIENTDWYKGCLQNILYILSYCKGEVQGLKDRLIACKVNGSQYEGDCCCLIGSLSSEKKENTDTYCDVIPFYTKGLHNLGEQYFYQIKEGDTAESNIFVKDAIMCCDMILGNKSV